MCVEVCGLEESKKSALCSDFSTSDRGMLKEGIGNAVVRRAAWGVIHLESNKHEGIGAICYI